MANSDKKILVADDSAVVASVLTASPGERQGRGRGAAPGGGAAAHVPAYLIKIAASSDGTFTVTNTRNGFQKTYSPRD